MQGKWFVPVFAVLTCVPTACGQENGGINPVALAAGYKATQMKTCEVVGRLQGRILGYAIRKGMTEAEVDAIVGKGRLQLQSAFLTGGLIVEYVGNRRFGLRVTFDNIDHRTGYPTEILRVTEGGILPSPGLSTRNCSKVLEVGAKRPNQSLQM